MSRVTDVSPAPSEFATRHFGGLLALQTDCDDVHNALTSGTADFILLDVRGPDAYARGHVPGSISFPHREITDDRMSQWPRETLFVVYCAGPHCNGADKAAYKLALLGRKVKMMIGGVKGWEDEGFAFTTVSEQGSLEAGPKRVLTREQSV